MVLTHGHTMPHYHDSAAPEYDFPPTGYRLLRAVCKLGVVLAIVASFIFAGHPGAITAVFGCLLSSIAIDILLELRSCRPKRS